VSDRPRLVGINHVALEVADVDAALEFYGRLFAVGEVERHGDAAFIELGDQFIALMPGRSQPPDTTRHFGLVVDDKEATRRALEAAGVEILPGRFLDFLDPWGNRVQVVQYDQIRFAKTPEVLEEMGLELSSPGAPAEP
jgi:catechol 2,3-dioxygenase-like lactoylglutathione lyase family enzyme